MRIVLGILSGVLGMLAGWFGLAFLVMSFAGPDRDGGVAMGAFFNIGPIGAVIGFGVGVWLFARFGLVGQGAASASAAAPLLEPGDSDSMRAQSPGVQSPGVAVAPTARKISRPFGVVVLAFVGVLAWWAWYELIRSPYLTHGYMTLALQFRLPEEMAPPAEAKDVLVFLDEAGKRWPAYLSERGWRGHQGSHAVILASVDMMYKAGRRSITLSMPDAPAQSWTLDLPSDPDPTPGYTAWRPSSDAPGAIDLNYRLTAER
jgi:hypothetical protein